MPAESRDGDIRALITLYQRCKERNALPFAGGLFEQPEEIMNYFDVIDQEIATFKAKHNDGMEDDHIKTQLARSL